MALQKILEHSYVSSPYYRQVLDEAGFRPTLTFKARDLAKLPFLTKDILRARKSSMVSDRFQIDQLHLSYTGGTTGTQTSFYLDHACKVARFGRQWGMLALCGYRPGMRRGLVWGVDEDLPPTNLRDGFKRWFRRYASGDEPLCCAVISDQLLTEYHGRLLRQRPEVLYGYPSALTQLGRFVEERSLTPIRVKAIITTAERLSAANRKQLAHLFGGEVFNLYCTREYGCIGFECAQHQGFHIDVGSLMVEIVKDGKVVEPGHSGELVITDLLNYGMPFIRSRTGDLGALSPHPCACGSPLPLLTGFDGRESDVLYRPDGSVVPGLMLTDLFNDLPATRYLQFVQKNVDQLDVLLVVTADFSEQVRAHVVQQVRSVMGDTIEVRVMLVDDIERNLRSGKLREVICTVGPSELARAAKSPRAQ